MSNLKERIREQLDASYDPTHCEGCKDKNEHVASTLHSLLLETLADQEKVVLGAVEKAKIPVVGDHSDCEVADSFLHDCRFNEGRELGNMEARSSVVEAITKYRQLLE